MDVLAVLNDNRDRILSSVAGDGLDWRAKGIVDDTLAVYPMSTDTKLVSKILELMMSVALTAVCRDNGLHVRPAPYQNYYPDFTVSASPDFSEPTAVDIKSTFRVSPTRAGGLTLGSFTGYFRGDRRSTKNIVLPYSAYRDHLCLVALYSRSDVKAACRTLEESGFRVNARTQELVAAYVADPGEDAWREIARRCDGADRLRPAIDAMASQPYATARIDGVRTMKSVITDLDVFAQEKWRIASDRPGSGNTKNIGSVTEIRALREGAGPFTRLENGRFHFDNYWMHYETKDMAHAAGREGVPLFRNLETYLAWCSRMAAS